MALMFRCVLCKFNVELDDAITTTRNGACICVRCFARATESEHRLPTALRRELEQTLAA